MIEFLRGIGAAREPGDVSDGAGIGEHVAIDRRTDVFDGARAADGGLHAVPDIVLPEKAVGETAFAFPGAVVGDEVVEEAGQEFAIAVNQVAVVSGRTKPTAVAMEMRLRFAGIAAEPEGGVIVEVTRIPKPAAFGEVKAGGATDGVENAGVLHGKKKLGDDEAVSGPDDVFAKGPPAEVIDFLEFAIGAFEEGDVAPEPGE